MIKVDYLQARDYIANGNSGKIVLGLDRVRKLCEFLGNPQDKVKLIHISGTNGKGSVGTFIASVLTASGYKVGRYTSPDVLNYRDKFSINGQWISEDEFASLTDVISRFVDKMPDRPTPFEIETALAYYFLNKMTVTLQLWNVVWVERKMLQMWQTTRYFCSHISCS